jgi:two-component system response regulator AtoC
VVSDAGMLRLHERAAAVAAGDISVFLTGETGTGKEILADVVHRRSPRRAAPFLRINCATLTETLFASELFGHEKGAFTGAAQNKLGLLAAADGGTVFLDEVGELPMALQVKLLRVIEDREITPVGGLRPRTVDVRFISATNRDLRREITRGTFREDLYYRLSAATLAVPPLRERPGEIEPLARLFLARAAGRLARRPPEIPVEVLLWMRAYRWPGNVRELRNAMERAALLCCDGVVSLQDIRGEEAAWPLASPGDVPPPAALHGFELGQVRGSADRAAVTEAMARCCGNQTRAAKMLNVSRGTLVARLNEYGFPRPRKGTI